MSARNLVITFARPYDGVTVCRDGGVLRIEIPFMNQASAERALGEMSVTIERGEPEVIQGQVMPDVPAITG